MTPKAQEWLNDRLLLPRKKRFTDNSHSLGYLEDFIFFDVTAYIAELKEFAHEMLRVGFPSARLSFLPAPKTWIEWSEPPSYSRVGFALTQGPDNFAKVVAFAGAHWPAAYYIGDFALRDHLQTISSDDDEIARLDENPIIDHEVALGCFWRLHAALVLINSPRTIGRSTHGPHRGLQRKLRARADLAGHNFNLTHQVLELEVRPPVEFGGSDKEVLTGSRALHFCRAYLWHSRGVVCPGHWRGDPSRGIRVTDYHLVPSSDPQYVNWKPPL